MHMLLISKYAKAHTLSCHSCQLLQAAFEISLGSDADNKR